MFHHYERTIAELLTIFLDNEMTARYEATSLAFLYEKLAPISIDDDLDGIQRKRAVGTCTWIANQEEFKPLLVGPPRAKPRMLWISGKPGSGKTYLAGYITEVLEEVGPTAAFFCATKDAGRTDAGNILRTLCWQLLQQMKRLIGEVAGLVRAAGTVTRKLLRSILKLLVRHEQRNAYIVLDGVDECEASNRAAILDTLDELSGPVCVIVLSRPESDIERAFLQWQRRGLGARLEITPQHTVADMHLYVMYGVRRLQYDDAALVATIVDCVTKNANGMFLYVRLMMDELDRQDTDKERRSVLEQLPAGIHALYDRSMDRIQAIQGPRRDRVIRLLQLALCAFRPLTVEELSAALAVQIGSSRLDPDDTPNVRKLFSEYCQSFLEINPKSDFVQVLHASVKDYLTDSTNGEPFVHLGKAHAYMTAICLTFINFEDRPFTARPSRHTLTCPPDDPFPFTKTLHAPLHAHLSKYPFLEYCVTSWVPHLHHSLLLQTPEITIIHHPLQVLFDSQTRTIKWMELFHFLCKEEHASAVLTRDIIESWILEHEKRKSLGGASTPPLASISAVPAVTFAMNGFRIIDERTSDLISPLQISFPNAIFLAELGQKWDGWISQLGFSGKYGIIRWKRWTKTEVMTRKPAHIAAFFGFTEFLKEQINNGLDPNDIDIMDRSLLGLASWGESISNIRLLLERGADINFCPRFSDCDGAFPLVEATSHDEFDDHRKRNFETANFLLDMGAKVESGVRALNPLHVMFQWWTENEDEMRLLERILGRSENLDRMLETQNPFNGMNCLHIAAMFNLGQTIIKIINSHSKPKDFIERIWGTDGRTALHEACSHPQSKAGLVLLAAKADVNKTTSTTQSTALGIAAASRSDILSELIKAGPDINARDSVQQTPLHNASWIDWAEGIEQLVAAGALIDAKDNQGRTPLDLALNMERTNAAERLRKLGADESEAHKISKPQHDVHIHRVSEIYFLLERTFGMVPSSRARQAPPSIIRRIVDAAELWIETSSAIHRPMITMQGNSGKPYLITRPVRGNGNNPIRKVVIAFASESCEGPHPPDQGEPKSWIWFDLGCKESWDSSNDTVRSGPTLVFNQLGMLGTQVSL